MNQSNRGIVIGTVSGIVLILVVILGLTFGLPAFNRYQALANAKNQVKVTAININNTKQLVEVENQKAQVRIADAEGIAKAQSIIAGSLTPAYLQYLAINTQATMANGTAHTVIYIPTGKEGIPLVGTIDTSAGVNTGSGG